MRKKLIANGVLAIIALLCAVTIAAITSTLDNITHIHQINITTFIILTLLFVLQIMIFVANIVMGIITLVAKKDDQAQSLITASGILAIFLGALGANAIVSFMAAGKLKGE